MTKLLYYPLILGLQVGKIYTGPYRKVIKIIKLKYNLLIQITSFITSRSINVLSIL